LSRNTAPTYREWVETTTKEKEREGEKEGLGSKGEGIIGWNVSKKKEGITTHLSIDGNAIAGFIGSGKDL